MNSGPFAGYQKLCPFFSPNAVVEIHLFSKGKINVLILPLKSA